MRPIFSHEDWGRQAYDQEASLLEAYSGTAVVQWHGNIERQILDKIEQSEDNRNTVYADKLREFLKIWRENEITGSINVEDLQPLLSASKVLAVDPWNLGNYFSNLRDQLRKLIAAAEQLPMMGPEAPTPPGRGSPSAPPSSFGPEETSPEMGPDGQPEPPKEGETGGPMDDFDIDGAVKDTIKSKTSSPTQ